MKKEQNLSNRCYEEPAVNLLNVSVDTILCTSGESSLGDVNIEEYGEI